MVLRPKRLVLHGKHLNRACRLPGSPPGNENVDAPCRCAVPLSRKLKEDPLEAGNRSTQRNNSVNRLNRFTTETKASFKTSEFWLSVAAIVAILIAAASADDAEGFGANQAWLYVAIVTSAYAISRGLAKSGSYEPYAVEPDGDVRSNAGN